MQMRPTAWIFDVDGVITDPQRKVVEPELLEIFAKLLRDECLLAFNTGRSIAWVQERVLTPLVIKLPDKNLLRDFVVIGEKGGTWLTFDEKGESRHEKDTAFIVPKSLEKELRLLVEVKYSDCMFFDETKETMISIEMHDGFDLLAYQIKQREFLTELEAILETKTFTEDLKIDPSIIAIDVEDKRANKALGVVRFLQSIDEKQLSPAKFFAFGDSLGDLVMADTLFAKDKAVEFVFVGEKEKLVGEKREFPITFFSGYSEGTRLFLEKHLLETS